MRARRYSGYMLAGGLLAGLACAGHSSQPEATAAARDTTMEAPPAYKTVNRDTTATADSTASATADTTRWSPNASGASEVQPGQSTTGIDSTTSDTTAR